jgi:hypothetical protein
MLAYAVPENNVSILSAPGLTWPGPLCILCKHGPSMDGTILGTAAAAHYHRIVLGLSWCGTPGVPQATGPHFPDASTHVLLRIMTDLLPYTDRFVLACDPPSDT